MAAPLRTSLASLVRLACARKFFWAAALAGLAACSGSPGGARSDPWAGAASSDAATEPSALDERLAAEARAKAEADRRAAEALRDAQIARERSDAARAELEAAREAHERASVPVSPPRDLGGELRRLQAQVTDLKVAQTARGWVLTLADDVLFDERSAALKAAARGPLDNVAALMRKHPDRDVAIEGFTDAAGPDDENHRLSERRAEAVKRALVARGIATERIDARGYGAAFPVASNETENGRQLNRRLEIVINPS